MNDTRTQAMRLAAVKRIVQHPDYVIYREYIAAKAQAHANECLRRIVTPAEQAEHNFNLGMVAALEHVLQLGEIISQAEEEKRSSPLAE